MTLCCQCGKDRRVGMMDASGFFVCGICEPQGAVAQHRNGARMSWVGRRQ